MFNFFRARVSFGIESPQQIQQQSHIQVVAQNLYNQGSSRTPVQYGMLDRRMVIHNLKYLYKTLIYYLSIFRGWVLKMQFVGLVEKG